MCMHVCVCVCRCMRVESSMNWKQPTTISRHLSIRPSSLQVTWVRPSLFTSARCSAAEGQTCVWSSAKANKKTENMHLIVLSMRAGSSFFTVQSEKLDRRNLTWINETKQRSRGLTSAGTNVQQRDLGSHSSGHLWCCSPGILTRTLNLV